MRAIFKYPIQITDYQVIQIPEWSKILHVGLDPNGVPCVWARVITTNKLINQEIWIFGTGNPVDDEWKDHQGTFIQNNFVWHVYM